jgi:hypothetical protein
MATDIALFYYYSSPSLPEDCYLQWDQDVAYRNMLMIAPVSKNKIHFEFPVFEDHSYNTICNLDGVRSLIKRPNGNEKYIIFRTKNQDTGTSDIVGYYKIGRSFYYETNMFNNNGFVWGIEADEPHLLKRDALEYRGPPLRQGYRTTWGGNEWKTRLSEILEQISVKENISQKYQNETNRVISIFKDQSKIDEWREFCESCENKCTFYRRNTIYKNKHQSDLFSVIYHAYTTNLYSRNELLKLKKIYLQ